MYIQLSFSLPAMGGGGSVRRQERWNHHRNKCTVLSAGPLTVTQVVCVIHTCTMGSKNLQNVFCGSGSVDTSLSWVLSKLSQNGKFLLKKSNIFINIVYRLSHNFRPPFLNYSNTLLGWSKVLFYIVGEFRPSPL